MQKVAECFGDIGNKSRSQYENLFVGPICRQIFSFRIICSFMIFYQTKHQCQRYTDKNCSRNAIFM